MSSTGAGLVALIVDDELPALADLGYLVGRDPRIGEVVTASSGTEALQVLERRDVDVVFSDISMPGLDGMALARVISRFAVGPQVVFVTAHDEHAVDAFAVAATDYVMKPVRADRIAEAIRRVVDARSRPGNPAGAGGYRSHRAGDAAGSAHRADVPEPLIGGPGPGSTWRAGAVSGSPEDETIPVELGGVTRFITRSQIRYAQAHGDYARLHTSSGSHLVRVPLAVLEKRWGAYDFVRIHRSTLVALSHVSEVRVDHGRCSVVVGDVELQVSRRHTRQLRDILLRRPSSDRQGGDRPFGGRRGGGRSS
jgi:DNA-binding LytR/AlgR family response regulator